MPRIILTLGELEALTSFGLTGLLTFNGARVAGHEAFNAQSVLVFGVNLNESASDSQTESFGLSFVTAAVEVHLDVVLTVGIEGVKRLFYDILKYR